jgi:hypothetical protein
MRPLRASTPPLEDHPRFRTPPPPPHPVCRTGGLFCIRPTKPGSKSRRTATHPTVLQRASMSLRCRNQTLSDRRPVHVIEGEVHMTDAPVEAGLGEPSFQRSPEGDRCLTPSGLHEHLPHPLEPVVDQDHCVVRFTGGERANHPPHGGFVRRLLQASRTSRNREQVWPRQPR